LGPRAPILAIAAFAGFFTLTAFFAFGAALFPAGAFFFAGLAALGLFFLFFGIPSSSLILTTDRMPHLRHRWA
jgi:hypothetical protein